MKLGKDFYLRQNVVQLAEELLGKVLFTQFDNKITSGIITETEAYAGITDKASHAYNNRRTNRTEIMFAEGGNSYIYLCYGIYSLFNVVTNKKDIPHAILIRGIKPLTGLETIQNRLKKENLDKYPLNGPGKLTKALGIHYTHSGINLSGGQIWIEDQNINIIKEEIICTKRIGVEYAKEDAILPYRFVLQTNNIIV